MKFLDFIRDRARYYNCPVCGRSLRDCELRMLRHVEDHYTVQVTCGACHVQFIVILAVQGEGLEAGEEELALDVELSENSDVVGAALGEAHDAEHAVEGGGRAEPIQSDEVLDVHLLLRGFSGRLTDLVGQPSGDRH